MKQITVFKLDIPDDAEIDESLHDVGIDEEGNVYYGLSVVAERFTYAFHLALQENEPLCQTEKGYFLVRLNWLRKNFQFEQLFLDVFEKTEKAVKEWIVQIGDI